MNTDDFVIEENIAYAVAILQDFFKNKKVLLEEDEEEDEECLALRAVEVSDNNDTIAAKYELSYEVDGHEFVETLDISVKFGLTKG